MSRLVIVCSFLLMSVGVFAQSNQQSPRRDRSRSTLDTTSLMHQQMMQPDNEKSEADTSKLPHRAKVPADSLKSKPDTTRLFHRKMMQSPDTLTMSDYTLAIERVNDNLITIGDSVKLGFDVVKISRRIDRMTDDVKLIRQNMRGRNTVFNIKNQFLYQSFTAKLDAETDRIQAQLDELHQKVYRAKLHLNAVLKDSVFRKLYAEKALRKTFDQKLVRLERRYSRTDSITKANVDTLNAINVRLSDNSYNLSNMLNIMDNRMDRALPLLFGPEVNHLWGKEFTQPAAKPSTKKTVSIFESEQNAVGYYISQTSGERKIIVILGILLFTWLYFKRKLIKTFREKEAYSYLHFHYLNNHPVLSLIVLLLCLMPLFDAYAPTSYVAIVYVLLLMTSTVIFFRRGNRIFLFNWLILAALFVADVLIYLMIEPTFFERVVLLSVHGGIVVFTLGFIKSLHKQTPYYHLLKWAAITAIALAGLGILLNLFGRFSLAGIVGIAAIFAVTQAVVLTVFIDVIIEVVLLQLQSSRLSKDNDKPFDISIVVNKIKMPLMVLAIILWLIMLTSNLNIYHWISAGVTEAMTSTRTIGSISFQLLSVVLFIGIIWAAHILQRMLSFFLGESATEVDNTSTKATKGQHSRLLITRLLVLIGGYLLAIAASGLPIDKLTFLLGALGVGIGMGLQGIVNNFVSGIILIFDGTLQIGDEIEVSGQGGKVKEIGLRASTLTTADGADVIIPNGTILSQNIVNWTFSNNDRRVVLTFSLTGKELDANVINEVINETIGGIEQVISKRKPVILYTKVTAESCSLHVRFWSSITHSDLVKSEAMLKLNTAFAAKKIGFE